MTYLLCILCGLAVGGLVAWLLASARVARSLTTRIEDLAQRANTAEGLASGLEATIVELRAQNQKAAEDLAKLREELAGENSARVKAETQLAETRQRLEEEKKLLEDAKAKLTDTFKALAGDTLNTSTTAFLNLAKETLDKVLADARGDIGKRQEAIQGLVNPVARAAIVNNRLAFERAPEDFISAQQAAETELKHRVQRAREVLLTVQVSEAALQLAVHLALTMGAEGHRADLVTIRAACALAALEGRTAIEIADIKRAAVFALRHRLVHHPLEDEEIDTARLVEQIDAAAAGESLPPASEKKSL